MQRATSSIPEPDPRERALAKTLQVPDMMARVLLARGLDDPIRCKRHLRPDLGQLHDPFLFSQMERVVQRIRKAVQNGEPILIHGDYDVDGITGAVLLLKFFRLMQADAKVFIPSREDGYSFTDASIQAARDGGFKLCISVDNGTNAIEPIRKIQEAGCDVIVTDHHGTTDRVAPAYAVLNPRLPDAGYPDRDLAGVGVAFRLVAALARSFSRGKTMSNEFRSYLVEAMAYVALGTVADVAPLRGDNRILVHHGLRALAASSNPGIRALMDTANLDDREPTVDDIAFKVAPLINAAGRMGSAMEAVELLTAPGFHEAQAAAKKLERHNIERRKVEKDLLERILLAAAQSDDEVLVLGGEGWHRGVLGIAAARIAESHKRPALLVSFENGVGRGSGRSAHGFHLHEALSRCADCMVTFGGHRAAVGMEVEQSKLEELRRRVNAVAKADPSLYGKGGISVDGEANLHELLEPRLVRQLEQLGPFGQGNPRPVFATSGLRVVGQPTVDARGQDLRFRVVAPVNGSPKAIGSGAVVPVRLRHGAKDFERVRGLKEPVTLYYSPRLTFRAEEGPVQLHAWHWESLQK